MSIETANELLRDHPGLHVEAHPSGALVLTGDICKHADPRRALREAACLPAGAIGLTERGYVLRYTIPEGRQDAETLANLIQYVAAATQRLAARLALAPVASDSAVFHHYGL